MTYSKKKYLESFFRRFKNTSKALWSFVKQSCGESEMGPLCLGAGAFISEVSSVKYLGVILDGSLRWDLQIESIVTRTRYLLGRFVRLRNTLTTHQLLILYNSLVQSHLNYGILSWGGAYNCHLNRLYIIQKWFLKIILNKPRTFPSEQLYKESKIMDLAQLFCFRMASQIHRDKSLLMYSSNPYQFRQQCERIVRPRARKAIGQRCFSYLSPRFYISVPENIKQINNWQQFKNKLKRFILEND